MPNAPDSAFTSNVGFSNWKKALSNEAGFKQHSKSELHINAMYAWSEFKRGKEANQTLLNALNEKHHKKVQENRHYIKTIAEVLLLTATQNMPQRGHEESQDSKNKGNFLAILDEIAKHDSFIQQRLEASGNAKYTSHQIQNEMLQTLAEMVQKQIIAEVKESEVFSVMADETKDLKKKEQMSLVVRYYYNGAIHESFLCFQAAEILHAEGLSQMIVRCLERHGLDYRSNLVGQGYDGASVMSGKHSGVAARIQSNARFAFYVHCNAHCLNLVLVDTTKAVPEVVDFFALLQQLYNFISGSYVHLKWLDVQRELYPSQQPRELQSLSDTRWACRYAACRNVRDRLPAVLKLLQDLSLEKQGERSVLARGLLSQIDLQFLGLLVTFCEVLGDAKCLSDMLQSRTLNLARAVDLVLVLLDRRMKKGLDKPASVLEFLVFLEPYKEVFHELFRLCKIAIVTPVSTASCERSFSALKLIKTHLRTTMLDDRLNHLAILSVESRRARALDMDDFVNHFATSHQNRRIVLF